MRYGPIVALENASFVVHPKEVVGLLGPNGAGKSTTMKILTTYLWPTSGTAKVCGRDVLTEPLEVRKRIGYLPEVLPLYTDMEVGSYLGFVGASRGLDPQTLKKRTGWVVERCGLGEVFRTPIRELSKGYRQRTGLAQALVHDPEVVVLDEPTSGLDPHQILEIRKLVRELAADKTVVFSTHILQEVEMVADRIVIVSRGSIVADGTLDELRRRAMKNQRIEVVVASSSRDAAKSVLSGLRDAKRVDLAGEKADRAQFRIEAAHDKGILKQAADAMREKKLGMLELKECPFSLEETFLALTEAESAKV
jgi:ABC-2 type transport system ATP-binding protein